MHTCLLNKIKEIITISDQEEVYLKSCFTFKSFKKNELLLETGKVCNEVFFIKKGIVCYGINNDGEDNIYYFNNENDFVCNYESYLPRLPSKVFIKALEPTSVLTVNKKEMESIYHSLAQGDRFGRIIIERVFVELIAQLTILYTQTSEERYLNFLSNFRDIEQRIPQYYIASYVGVKPQSLSRIRKRISSSR
ncbi:Crp/Fnr family transcriptional regulator [Aquimarina sp. U1-2]|uniref:Crp/Fnr family transcriptional regulator n=1 Tax=Aquimarina sp. U1-2 TaxID=2823141 RepID=UPI001AECEB19|nr:Crp/Fnr family transcriptional regulator [Aquimarina sp. U1-2]MBP2833745.1 Crp/Fnr family transcriptional regulator [Aquimarina sp. U1-2]